MRQKINNKSAVLPLILSGQALVNYRLNISLDENEINFGRFKDKLDGYVMDHTFGFGVLRNQNVRL